VVVVVDSEVDSVPEEVVDSEVVVAAVDSVVAVEVAVVPKPSDTSTSTLPLMRRSTLNPE